MVNDRKENFFFFLEETWGGEVGIKHQKILLFTTTGLRLMSNNTIRGSYLLT